ncbi:HMCN [Mytilus coruscus]|uniref:HMCN n=1 Tax=Mytilus coruscus TaxID=42192 RepID=A0A6J8E9F2_MYTCO|nr:HMCN [Mytilus coruscus]
MQIIRYMIVANITSALVYEHEIYADVGDTVNLTCNLTTKNYVTWLVPPNLQQYAVGNSLNTKLMMFLDFKLIRNIDSIEILKILNFSNQNQGQYRCQIKEDEINFNVFPSVTPSNITIVNETTSKEIVAFEGHTCQLLCRVASGLPAEKLSWSHAGEVLVEGGPGNIAYSFIPSRYDDGENFTCSVYRKSTQILLMRNIRVSVYFKPNVIVNISPSDTVVEGNSLVISCIHDSNDKDATIRWIPECQETLKTSGQCRIDSVKRTAAGTYTCEVVSKVGRVRNSSTLNILYAPDISIYALSINDSCIYLECIAKGIPDVPVFARWQHRSSLGTPIRLLENSSVLCIQPNSYKDHGLYICNVTNYIPNNGGEVWLQKTYNKTYSGRPFFTTRNKRVQYAAFRKLKKLYFYVVSGLKITIDESKTFTNLPGINNISNCISSRDIDDVIYDVNVKVTGYEIIVETIIDDAEGFGNYTIHLANSAGTTEFEFEVKSAGLCKQCSIKMSFCKSDNSQVKLNTCIEEDIDLDSQLTFLSTTTELSQQSASDWETDNASDRNNFNQPNKQQKLSNFKTSVKSSMG